MKNFSTYFLLSFLFIIFSILLMAYQCSPGGGVSCDDCPNTSVTFLIDGYDVDMCPPMNCTMTGDFTTKVTTKSGNGSGWMSGSYYHVPFQKKDIDCNWLWGGTWSINQNGRCADIDGRGNYYKCFATVNVPAVPCNQNMVIKLRMFCNCQ